MQRAVDELITLLTKVCRPVSLSVMEQGDLLLITNLKRPRKSAPAAQKMSKSGFFWNDKESTFSLIANRDSKTRIPGRL